MTRHFCRRWIGSLGPVRRLRKLLFLGGSLGGLLADGRLPPRRGVRRRAPVCALPDAWDHALRALAPRGGRARASAWALPLRGCRARRPSRRCRSIEAPAVPRPLRGFSFFLAFGQRCCVARRRFWGPWTACLCVCLANQTAFLFVRVKEGREKKNRSERKKRENNRYLEG